MVLYRLFSPLRRLVCAFLVGGVLLPLAGAPALAAKDAATVRSARNLLGRSIMGRDGELAGTVYDILVGRERPDDPYALISVGGIAGIGDRLVAVPLSQLRPTADGTLAYAGDKDFLLGLPAYHPSEARRPSQSRPLTEKETFADREDVAEGVSRTLADWRTRIADAGLTEKAEHRLEDMLKTAEAQRDRLGEATAENWTALRDAVNQTVDRIAAYWDTTVSQTAKSPGAGGPVPALETGRETGKKTGDRS